LSIYIKILHILYTPWGEKLAVFIEFKKRDPSDLRPQDDEENLIII